MIPLGAKNRPFRIFNEHTDGNGIWFARDGRIIDAFSHEDAMEKMIAYPWKVEDGQLFAVLDTANGRMELHRVYTAPTFAKVRRVGE